MVFTVTIEQWMLQSEQITDVVSSSASQLQEKCHACGNFNSPKKRANS